MRKPLPNPFRPTDRARRRVIALVVVALVGWLGIAAGHLHLPADVHAHAHAYAHAHAHADAHGPAVGAHGPETALLAGPGEPSPLDGSGEPPCGGHGEASAGSGTGDPAHADRPHLCAVCLALERANGGVAPPTLPPPPAAAAEHRRPAVAPTLAALRVGAHRSRGPPA